jgi:hypothetical protein
MLDPSEIDERVIAVYPAEPAAACYRYFRTLPAYDFWDNTDRPGTSAVPGPVNVGYSPVKFGARLALKASTPSLKSADCRKRL